MKRNIIQKTFKQGLLAVPAAAMMLGAAHGAQIGINFADNYAGNSYAALTDPSGAFGIPLADWYNAPEVLNSYAGGGVGTNGTWNLPGGGALNVAWSARNTWSLYAAIPGDGNSQVIYGYLDDPGDGYSVTLSGLRAFASDFTITTIASTDGGSSFEPVRVTSTTDTNTLEYLANYPPGFANGLAGTSTVSSAFVTLNGNDMVTISGLPKTNSQMRSTLAGIIIDYTPSTVNPPLVEANPQAPAGQIFPGDSFVLSSLASGAPTLQYQWRQDGNDISGATFANYTNTSAVAGDSGDYDVVVTNPYGAATSTVAQVTVQEVLAPVITQAPVSQSFYEGYPATFSAAATGGQLSYQWKSNSVAIPDATNATYTIPSITAGDAGTYTIEVSNPVGPTASASATLTVKVPAVDSYEAAVASTQPMLWYRYSETGPKPVDYAYNMGSLGAPGNGTYVGSVSRPITGALVGSTDTAATFSGGKVSVPYNAALNPAGAFSVDCWINPNASGTGMIVQEMINGENPANEFDRTGWGLRLNNTGLRFLVGDIYAAPYYYYYTTADNLITPGVWQHVAMVYDGTAPTLYVNGVVAPTTVTRQDNVAMTQPEIDAIRIIPNYAAPMIIGDRGFGGWTFQGGIDEVALYSSALTSGQVLGHYQNGVNPTPPEPYNTLVTGDGAVEYLRLDEPALVPPVINSGTLGVAFGGSYAGDIIPNTVGPRPTAQPGFETDNIAVAMTNGFSTTAMLPLNTNYVTVTCWVKRQSPSSTGDLSWPAWLGNGGMDLRGNGDTDDPHLRYHWNADKWGWDSGLPVPADVWTFCALVITPNQATVYVSDGDILLQNSTTTAHAPMNVTSTPGFGGNQDGRADRNYIGQLDETTVYNRALSQSEITTLFLVGTGAPFQMDIVAGGIIEDTNPSGTPHNGRNLGTTWLPSSTDSLSVTREGVEVFNTADATQIVTPASPDFNSTTGTFTFWMRANAPIPGPGNEAAMIMDRRTSSGTVITLNDAGELFVQCAGGANSFSSGFLSYLPDNNWHNVAVTYDQAFDGTFTQGIEIFIDGVSYGFNPNTAAWSWPAAQQIELGRSHDGYWKRYNGELDDFRIYNRILTPTEVAAVASSDAVVDGAALVLRYNFDTAGIGYTVQYPFGTLESSPALNGPEADWQPVPGATPPNYPIPATEPARFFRATP